MSLNVESSLPAGKLARLRETVRRQIVEERTALKVYENPTELEVTCRVDDILRRRAESGQLEIEFPDIDPMQESRISKRSANNESQPDQFGLLDQVRQVLESVGVEGASREDIGERIGKRVTDVCKPVLTLIKLGEATQPRRKPSRRGSTEAVVVLTKFLKDLPE